MAALRPAVVAAQRLRAAVLLLALAAAAQAAAQPRLYKYQDANGVWVYTDRRPDAAQAFEESELRRSFEPAEVRLYQKVVEGDVVLVAQNGYFAPVQIAFELTRMENLAADTPRRGLVVVQARTESELFAARKADPSAPLEIEYRFDYLPGDPDATHAPREPYRLPYAVAASFPVSQAFPDVITHNDLASQHAYDFVMPVGTGVHAAREGVVIEVASDYYGAGLDPATDGPRANIVRVLHEDGTMALYAHLNWNSIRVVPGQRVTRGQPLADSGNTGFSTGPHLHFVVQRNRDGALVSVPVQFSGAAGAPIEPRTGERPVAH